MTEFSGNQTYLKMMNYLETIRGKFADSSSTASEKEECVALMKEGHRLSKLLDKLIVAEDGNFVRRLPKLREDAEFAFLLWVRNIKVVIPTIDQI